MPEVIAGIEESWLDEGIISYTISDINIHNLGKWNEHIIQHLETWSPEQGTFRALYDLSARGVGMTFLVLNNYQIYNVGVTPGGQKQVSRILTTTPELKVRLALVLSSSLSGQITRKRAIDVDAGQVEYQVFFAETQALEWLNSSE